MPSKRSRHTDIHASAACRMVRSPGDRRAPSAHCPDSSTPPGLDSARGTPRSRSTFGKAGSPSPEASGTQKKPHQTREARRAYERARYAAHRDDERTRALTYQKTHSEKYRARKRRYYAKHKDKVLAAQHRYLARKRAAQPMRIRKSPEEKKEAARLWRAAYRKSDRGKAARARYRRAHPEAKARYRERHKAQEAARDKRYRDKHREQRATHAKAYYAAHPEALEKVRAGSAAWKKAHPESDRAYQGRRRALMAGVTIGERKAIASIYKLAESAKRLRCYWRIAPDCRVYPTPGQRHVDHIFPLGKGGGHSLGQLVVSCDRCNMSKGAKLPEEFAGQAELRLG